MEHQTLKIGQELKDLEIVSDEKEEIQPKKKIGRPVKYTDEQRKKLKNEKRKKKFEENPEYAKKQNENIKKWQLEHREQMEKTYRKMCYTVWLMTQIGMFLMLLRNCLG